VAQVLEEVPAVEAQAAEAAAAAVEDVAEEEAVAVEIRIAAVPTMANSQASATVVASNPHTPALSSSHSKTPPSTPRHFL
jgi:hypothetical protein